MMTAMPALSSPPSSVVPSVVITVLPIAAANSGLSAASNTCRGSPGNTISPPSYLSITCGRTPAPVVSGEVSKCALKATTGGDSLPSPRPIRRQRRDDDGMFILRRIGKPHRLQLAKHDPPQFPLPGRRRIIIHAFSSRGIDPHITQKSLKQPIAVHSENPETCSEFDIVQN